MAIHQKTENQTAYSGVPVFLLTTTHMRESGIRRSREKAKTVRARACMAVKADELEDDEGGNGEEDGGAFTEGVVVYLNDGLSDWGGKQARSRC